jgi:4-amino-4-deoxy-L-arabinose transferase-like glycosyltransferase
MIPQIACRSHERLRRKQQLSQVGPAPSPALALAAVRRALSARWLPVAVFGFALLVRALYLLEARDDPLHDFVFALIDSLYYHRHALEVARGDFLHGSPFFLGPLYPYFMGWLYALLEPSPEVVRWAQALLGAASCALLFAIAARVLDRRAALLSGLLLAVYPLHVYYTDILLPTVLVVFLNLLLLWSLLRAAEAPSPANAAACGLVLGLATLAKSNALLLLPAYGAVWLWLDRDRPRRLRLLWCGAFAAAALAVISPATLHNWLVSEHFVLVTTSTGRNLWKGNGPIANGTHPLGHQDRSRAGLGRRLAGAVDPEEAAEESGDYVGRTLEYVREHPAETARLLLKKLVLFSNAVELGVRDQFYFARDHSRLLRLPVAYAWVAPLGLVGALWAWRPRSPMLFLHVLLAVQVLSFVAVFVLARYRLVAVTCLIVFASALLGAWLDAARAGRWRSLAPQAGLVLVLGVLVNWPLAEFPKQRGYALVYEKIGDMHMQEGDPRAAIAAWDQALDLDWQGQDPNAKRGETLFEIARARRGMGDREGAARTLRRLLEQTTLDDLRAARVRLKAEKMLEELER